MIEQNPVDRNGNHPSQILDVRAGFRQALRDVAQEVFDGARAFDVQAAAGGSGCEDSDARTVDDILVEKNIVSFSRQFGYGNNEFAKVEAGGDTNGETLENLTIQDNIVTSSGVSGNA